MIRASGGVGKFPENRTSILLKGVKRMKIASLVAMTGLLFLFAGNAYAYVGSG